MIESDAEACERCGAYLHKRLVHFHKCNGTALHLRPANIPLEQWVRQQRNVVEFDIGAVFKQTTTTIPRPVIKQPEEPVEPSEVKLEKPDKYFFYYLMFCIVVGGSAVIWAITMAATK